jgi:hypothetical protein
VGRLDRRWQQSKLVHLNAALRLQRVIQKLADGELSRPVRLSCLHYASDRVVPVTHDWTRVLAAQMCDRVYSAKAGVAHEVQVLEIDLRVLRYSSPLRLVCELESPLHALQLLLDALAWTGEARLRCDGVSPIGYKCRRFVTGRLIENCIKLAHGTLGRTKV